MYTINKIENFGLPRIWQYSEKYLNIGQQSYGIQDIQNKLIKLKPSENKPHWLETTLKVISFTLIIPFIVAIGINYYFRSKYQFNIVDSNLNKNIQSNSTLGKTTLFLVRHGETTWNTQGLLQGHANTPLNETGIAQAKSIAQVIAKKNLPIKAIYSSDLLRASKTAEETAKIFNLSINEEQALREISWGEAEGINMKERNRRYLKLEQELDAKYPDRAERWKHTAIPGSETNDQVATRTTKILQQISDKHKGENIIIFTHSRVIRVLSTLFSAPGQAPHVFPNCCIAEFHSRESPNLPFKFININ